MVGSVWLWKATEHAPEEGVGPDHTAHHTPHCFSEEACVGSTAIAKQTANFSWRTSWWEGQHTAGSIPVDLIFPGCRISCGEFSQQQQKGTLVF